VIEWIFGVVKWHFKALVVAQEYSLDRQSQLISALGMLHNFILLHDPDDILKDFETTEDDADNIQSSYQDAVSNTEQARAAARQDKIAQDLWQDFERGVRRHRHR
jgi:hypothetical protein